MGLFGFGKKNRGVDTTPPVTQQAPVMTNTQAMPTTGHEVTLDLSKGGLLNLQKNDFLDLSKVESTFEHMRVSAGWDVNVGRGDDYDLDLCAMLIGADGRVVDSVNNLVYYGKKESQGIELDHDNLTGEGEGDDENMFVNLTKIHPDVYKILLCVVIYQGRSRGQYFGKVRNAYVRLVDEGVHPEKEICRYNLSEDGGRATAVKFAELDRNPHGWSFKAIGEYANATIEDIRNQYR